LLLHCFCIFLSIDLIRCAAILPLVSRVSLLSCLVRHVNLSFLFSLHFLPVPYTFVDAFISSILSIRPSPFSLVMTPNSYCALGLYLLLLLSHLPGKAAFDHITHHSHIEICTGLHSDGGASTVALKGFRQWVWPPHLRIMLSSWV